MDFAGIYLVDRLVFRIRNFFHHWYVHGTRRIAHDGMNLFESLDQTFALKITLIHFFEPLYGDYSVVGRFFGIVLRAARLLVGGVIYSVIAFAWGVVFLLWWSVPVVIMIFALYSYRHA